jgi:signal transduction histidine kinase
MRIEGGKLAIKIQKNNPPKKPSDDHYPRYVEVSIADTGPGIPPDIQDKIFMPFFTTRRDGNGIGLAISKRIITAHKGTIKITSMPGGSVFHVLIPTFEEYQESE